MNRNRLHMRFTSASVCWIAVCSACLFVGCGGGGAGGPGGGGDEPTDVQQAKNMVNFVRDVAASSRKLGLDATEVFEAVLAAQQRIDRGFNQETYLSSHVSHLFNVFVQLEGSQQVATFTRLIPPPRFVSTGISVLPLQMAGPFGCGLNQML